MVQVESASVRARFSIVRTTFEWLTARAQAIVITGVALGGAASGQTAPWLDLSRCTDVVVPATRSFTLLPHQTGVELVAVRADVRILEETAATTLELELQNGGAQPAEAIVLLPVPDGAAVSGFSFDGPAPEATAQVLPRDQARRLYDEIVSRLKDPALLEFAGFNVVRSSLFPVPAHGRLRVRLTYEHLLERDGDRVDYLLPRSESLGAVTPWEIAIAVRSRAAISMVYSPSHDLAITRVNANHVAATLAPTSRLNPGPFRLSFLRECGGLSASLFAYPDPRLGGGYFLLMAGLPTTTKEQRERLLREVTVVIDRSGSMAGPKLDQAKAAALEVVEGLADGEWFNIIDYSTAVAQLAAAPVQKGTATTRLARDYLAALRPTGGTNIYDALSEALRQPHAAGTLPLVLFLTDGLPTVRNTSETAIRELVLRGNPHGRRIFTFGVGADVNAPLLDRIADATRASTTYVLPGEDVELKVAQVYKKLYGPVLSDVRLETLGPDGAIDTRRVREQVPATLSDQYDGDSLIVLGQYVGEEPLSFRVTGNYLGQPREFRFRLDLQQATTRNAFVPRLWATRQIAWLVDQVRELGAEVPSAPWNHGNGTNDPRLAELTQEILRLSTEFGILTEYTSFLATDGANLGSWSQLSRQCNDLLEGKAVRGRTGAEGIAQGCNYNDRKSKSTLDYRNGFVDAKLARVESATVQQLCDRAFFQNRGQWVDARLINKPGEVAVPAIDETIELGSPAWHHLVDELIEEGRAALVSMRGDILLEHRGRRLLVRNGIE